MKRIVLFIGLLFMFGQISAQKASKRYTVISGDSITLEQLMVDQNSIEEKTVNGNAEKPKVFDQIAETFNTVKQSLAEKKNGLQKSLALKAEKKELEKQKALALKAEKEKEQALAAEKRELEKQKTLALKAEKKETGKSKVVDQVAVKLKDVKQNLADKKTEIQKEQALKSEKKELEKQEALALKEAEKEKTLALKAEKEKARSLDVENKKVEKQIVSAQNSDHHDVDCNLVVSPDKAISTNGGKWQGWGTSLCWWANRIGYDKTLVKLAAETFFDPKDGLGLNIMRYNIGGGDDPTHNHITRTDSDVPGWQTYDALTGIATWQYDADARQLAVMKAAYKAAGKDVILEMFSNSPPYFMTNSGCSTGSFNSVDNNLRDDCYKQFAHYMVGVADYVQKRMGLKVTSLSPMNEPNTNYWPAMNYKQEGCHFDAGGPQSRIIEETALELKRMHIDNIMVVGSDETNPGKQVEEWEKYSQGARDVLGRINVHTYGTNSIREMGQLAKRENINLWMSEVDGNGTLGRGEMAAGLWLADKIISDIAALEPSAWVLWQVIDTHVSKEGYKGRADKGPLNREGGYWGTAWADHDAHTIELTQKYYALGQFSRYIRPGSTIILCNPERGSQIRAIASVLNRKVTVVVVNTSADEKWVSIDLNPMNPKDGAKCSAYRTSGSIADGEHWSPVTVPALTDNRIETAVPSYSITTFVVE